MIASLCISNASAAAVFRHEPVNVALVQSPFAGDLLDRIHSLAELARQAKAKPGQLQYASAGIGGTLRLVAANGSVNFGGTIDGAAPGGGASFSAWVAVTSTK